MKYKLSEICSGITDGSHNPPLGVNKSNFLMLSSKNIYDDLITYDEPRYLTETEFAAEDKRTSIKSGDILMTIVGTVGRTAVVDEQTPLITLQRSVAVLHPKKDRCNSRYLMYLLRSKRQFFEAESHGVAQKGIYLKQLSEVCVNIPDILEQVEIVGILDKIQNIIRIRQRELNQLDNLVKARFVEMFDGRGYPILKWHDVFNTTTGKLDSNAAVENGDYPFFTCSKDILRIDKYAFDQEALLLAGNNAAGKYDVKYYKGKFNAYQRTYVLSLKGNWSYRLLQYQLEDKLIYLQQQSLGGLTKYLTLKILGELEFIIPPMELQQDFSNFVAQIDKTKLTIQKSLEKTQLLFDSLMQEYFG